MQAFKEDLVQLKLVNQLLVEIIIFLIELICRLSSELIVELGSAIFGKR